MSTQGARYSVEASCCEIYNECVTDMLGEDGTQQLQVQQCVWVPIVGLGKGASCTCRQLLLGIAWCRRCSFLDVLAQDVNAQHEW